MKKTLFLSFLLLVLLMLQASTFGQKKTVIKGKITDESRKPLPFANVYISNSPDGTMSEDDGTFSFPTRMSGHVQLEASIVGYRLWTKVIEIKQGTDTEVDIQMQEKAISLKEAIVTASSYGSEKEKGLIVSRLDVMMTPGGAADIYQALKTMPGITQVSESAELYVRGGDALETTTIIDQAMVYHPFTFESAYGGLFSNINTNVVKSLFFTSGGFSAKYGNCLSGVLEIETRNLPENRSLSAGLSLANTSLSFSLPVIENRLGMYMHYNENFTKPLFWLNGGVDRFTAAPSSKNVETGIIYNYSKTGRIKLFGIYAGDLEGVNVEKAEYAGEFHGDSRNIFLNIQHTDLPAENLIVRNSLAYTKYSNQWKIGVLDLTRGDRVYSFRNDIEYILSSRSRIIGGIEYENRSVSFEGTVPYDDYNLRPGAEEKKLDSKLAASRIGAYTEYQAVSPLGLERITFTGGVRTDRFLKLDLGWTDIRSGISYRLNDWSSLSLAWGIFHQLPDPRYFSPEDGNPSLGPMKAIHYIASYDYKLDDQNSFRVELYHKKYEELPVEKATVNYDNSGYGYANGVDVIFKGTLPLDINGWISYGYISTKRNWLDYKELTSSSFDITHSLTIVAKYNITNNFQLGLTARYATGRPYTPVVNSVYHNQWGVFEPVYGSSNSARFPDYRRVDLRLTYLDQAAQGMRLVAYLEGLNILNLKNIHGYTYSEDYSQRKEIKSYFGYRMLVLGFNLDID